MWNRLLPLLMLFVAIWPAAAGQDPRGWSDGPRLAGLERALTPPAEVPELPIPKLLQGEIKRETLIFYFSPTCPHCQAVAPEVQRLVDRTSKQLDVIAVSTSRATPAELARFRTEFGLDVRTLVDEDRDVLSSLQIRSTPSALLVKPSKKGKMQVIDLWYPYRPGDDTRVELRLHPGAPMDLFKSGEVRGTAACATCHEVEAASWGLTHHSVAWKTLEDKEKTGDPACVSCHVTLPGEGYKGASTPQLVNVGCESCHGPSGPHDGKPTDAKAACATCHDAEHSIAFSLEKGLPHIDHYKAATLDDAGYRTELLALHDGEKSRPLLAFPEGQSGEAAQCASCHSAIQSSYATTAHATSISKLVGVTQAHGDRAPAHPESDAACLSCHATPSKSSLPLPKEASAYLTSEGGVSCASCHGPAEAHLAAPQTEGLIEGLGDDCPVCVIEAVCTSCHTAKVDPTWDLTHDLPLAGHAQAPGR